ncbi:ArsR/SmtB family transcription factor [Miltoncostaea marina]|uniref:ArsR/SmtB family transcription factor n=1 Tax=Miltoncostaea marina TaxID=2843215 RepID=UPI001C3D0194|nr:metalloregulator ArsR/SmtB family transcription factor [Miltoncostaea marina]
MTTNVSDGLTALADPTRRALFERLAERPRSVGELAAGVPVSRPAVSQHLRVLKDAGLVRDRREGTRRIYGLDPDGIGAMRAYLDRFWTSALAAFKDAAEADTQEDR